MNRMMKMTSTLLLSLAFVSALFALEIPLSGGGESAHGGAKIGYVDMDRIFQVFPQTLSAKEDYAKQLKKKKDQLTAKEAELVEIKNRISVLESTLGGATATEQNAVNNSTPSDESAKQPASVSGMKKDLEDKKLEYEEMRKQAQADLAAFQNQQSQMILGKIYQALRDLALEEQITVVVDKSSILYGDATIDLTDRLQQRVRGF